MAENPLSRVSGLQIESPLSVVRSDQAKSLYDLMTKMPRSGNELGSLLRPRRLEWDN